MTVIPIFIYREKKSDKEISEEMKRDSRWHELMEKEEELKRQRKREEEERKRREKKERRERINNEYEALRKKDEWQTQFMPEGWSVFGQTNFGILEEYFEDETVRTREKD